jgi:hypothetical protein
MVADLHQFDEEQDPDPHQSERLDPDPYQNESAGFGSASTRIRKTGAALIVRFSSPI